MLAGAHHHGLGDAHNVEDFQLFRARLRGVDEGTLGVSHEIVATRSTRSDALTFKPESSLLKVPVGGPEMIVLVTRLVDVLGHEIQHAGVLLEIPAGRPPLAVVLDGDAPRLEHADRGQPDLVLSNIGSSVPLAP